MNKELFENNLKDIVKDYRNGSEDKLFVPELLALGEKITAQICHMENIEGFEKPSIEDLTHSTRDTNEDIIIKLAADRNYLIESSKDLCEGLNNEMNLYENNINDLSMIPEEFRMYPNCDNVLEYKSLTEYLLTGEEVYSINKE